SLLSTYGGLVTFQVNTSQITLDHTIQRGWNQTINCQLSLTSVHVVDWYTNNNLASFAEIFLDNASNGTPIFALNASLPSGTASSYLLPGQYDVNIRYIDRFRVHNQTTPLQVSGTASTHTPIGVVATEHATELSLVRPSTIPYIEVGYNTTTRFVVQYKDLVTGQPIYGAATSIPYVANWTLSNSTHDNIDSGLLNSVAGEPGNYSVLFDATGYLVNETYQLRILLDVNAPVDYWQAYLAVGILIRGREVQIRPESTSYSVFWNDTVTFVIYLNDTATNQPITGAIPTYFGVGFSGTLLPNGTDGWYATAFRIENITQGTYTITIRAQIAAYEDATTQILLYVAPQPTEATLIEGYTSTQDGQTNRTLTHGDWWVPVGDLLVFTFNYTGMYDQLIPDAIGQISYQVGYQSLEYLGNGLYRVIIDTSTIPVGSYSAAVGFSKQNFDVAILSFTIEVRLIPTEIFLIHPDLNGTYFEGFVTDLLRVRVNVTDTWHNVPLTNATLTVYLSGLGYPPMFMYKVPGLPGVYELGGISLLREGIFDLRITAIADNHEPTEFIFQLRIETHPVTRNLVTFGLIAAIIGIIILIGWVAYTRVFSIPWLVRKMKKMSTTLGKGKTPKLSSGDQRRISTRPDQMTDFMQDAYSNARLPFVTTAVPAAITLDEREAEEVDIWRELDQLTGLGRDQKLELFEEMKRIPPKDRIWF
ncbi:MAG: hypothetical protein Q6361_03355, partial [Candidatus Hermodarchaeota archaeon]|nr:hypothetical protein [Candidatus Hermodarchaeota archaeon]